MPSGSGITLRASTEASIPTPAADQVTVFSDADDTNAPAYKDEGGVVTSLRGAPGADAPLLQGFDAGTSGAAYEFDLADGDVQELELDDDAAISFTSWPAPPEVGVLQAIFTQPAIGGPFAPTFGVEVDWGEAGEPTWSTTAGMSDIVKFETLDAGTRVLATVDGRPGPPGTDGLDGPVGGAIAIPYVFSTTTTDSDPGSGKLRLSSATQDASTVIRADLADANAATVTGILDSFADTSNAILGDIRLFKTADPTAWIVFEVASVASPSGYRNITVTPSASSTSSPFANNDPVTLAFTRSGDQGSTVGSGTLTTIEEVDGSPTDSAVTKLVLPNGTLGIVGHVATYTPAAALAMSQLGYTTVGGTQETMTALRFYTKKITLAATSWIGSISASIQGLSSQAEFLRWAVWSDNAGTPQYVQTGVVANFYLQTAVADGTARWISGAIGRKFAAGDYWIGIMCAGTSAAKINYDGSGSDHIWTATIDDITDAGSIWAVTDSTRKYSIYADILS